MKNKNAGFIPIILMLMLISIILLTTDIFYSTKLYEIDFVAKWLIKMNENIPLNFYGYKLIASLFVLLSCFFMPLNPVQKTDKRVGHPFLIIAVSLILVTMFLTFKQFSYSFISGVVYGFLSFLYWLMFLIAGIIYKSSLAKGFADTEEYEKAHDFKQETKIIETEHSVNLKHSNGYLNIVEPNRHVATTGNTGSGKTFSVLEPALYQMIQKGYCGCLYDYQYPDLSTKCYNYWKASDNDSHFYYVNFDNLSASHRINPLDYDSCTDIIDANQYANALYMNWSNASKDKSFWDKSEIALLTAAIYFFRLHGNPSFFTLPHILELISKPNHVILQLFDEHSELDSIIAPFKSAYLNGAKEQLAGQTDTLRIDLGQLSSPKLYWSLSKNEVPLKFNDASHPSIICLGNNMMKKEAYAFPLSLILTTMTKLTNRPGGKQSFLFLDEFTTVKIPGFDSFLATVRKNKVSTWMITQDLGQYQDAFGIQKGKAMYNLAGTKITGAVTEEGARFFQEHLGKTLHKRKSYSVNDGVRSESISEQMDYVLKNYQIAQFSQGEMAGLIADSYENPLKFKTFHGNMIAQKFDVENEKLPDLRTVTEGMVKANYLTIKNDVESICAPYYSTDLS